MQIEKCQKNLYSSPVKIDMEKQLVILEEEYEASYYYFIFFYVGLSDFSCFESNTLICSAGHFNGRLEE